MDISADDIDAYALGCDLLGSGGGGSTSAARHILAHHLDGGGAVQVIDGLAPGAFVVCVGAVGSAAVMLESLPTALPFVRAVRMIEERLRPVEAVLPLEVGGVNGLLAVLAAGALDLPLVDADPMGRAYTEVHRSVLGAAVPFTALAFASTGGGSAYLEAGDAEAIERMVRSMLPSVGGWGAVACHAGDAEVIVGGAVRGPVSRALVLGRALARAAEGDPDALLALDDVRVVFEGTVVEVTRRPGMEVGGVVSIQHRLSRLRLARVDFANEYAALYDNGRLEACAPDLICVLDEASWLPVSVDRLTAHRRVRVIAITAPAELREAHDTGIGFGLQAHGFAPVGGTT
ncbi:S-methyl thiohydantoin desulfurase domain-containing protein [Spirillospora sp. CA-294931]|uniref:S-methyl thiohydantoin desulfurase domain-containing protein n=1 Tax=Spirillospora sp. CA-294931 TaxID=3240042 RepID=UPI003D944C28